MGHSAGAAIPVPSLGSGIGHSPAAPLTLKFLEPADLRDEHSAALLSRRSASALRRLSATYAPAGAVHATVVTALLCFSMR